MDTERAEQRCAAYFKHPAKYGKEIPCKCMNIFVDNKTGEEVALLRCITPDGKMILAVFSENLGVCTDYGAYDERAAQKDGIRLYRKLRRYRNACAKGCDSDG